VCCWREGVREAFSSSGADVQIMAWPLPPEPPPPADASEDTGGTRPRGWWLPSGTRQALRNTYYSIRRQIGRLKKRVRQPQLRVAPQAVELPEPKPPLPGLADSAIVIAESADGAEAARASGIPRHRLWGFALPATRLDATASEEAREIVRLASTVGGILTDSDRAREAIERATSTTRPLVLIYPPLAIDRTCPQCTEPLTAQADQPDIAASPAQLIEWRAVVEQLRGVGPGEGPYSFVAARVPGRTSWKPLSKPYWKVGATTTPVRLPGSADSPDWSSSAQKHAAQAMLKDVIARKGGARAPRGAVVSGYDLKFILELVDRLNRRADLEITIDEWPMLSRAAEESEARVYGAQSILAEWARPSAVLLSQRKRADQFLVVRLHRFEIDTRYPHDIAIENVDAVVYIAPLMGRRIRDELGWPTTKLIYIPNFISLDWLERPKLSEARFGLGLVGMLPMLKRFDLALDLLSTVRKEDPRFKLFVRSALPWQNQYVWADAEQREYFAWCFERMEQDPLLRGAVVLDPPGRDMARWYRRVGHILSASDLEGGHTAVAEGMASGAVPVIRPWAGAREIYGEEWLMESIDEAATGVLRSVDAELWAERSAQAKSEVRRTHDPLAIEGAWADLLHCDVEVARSYFAQYAKL